MRPDTARQLRSNIIVVLQDIAQWWNERKDQSCKLSVNVIGDRKVVVQQTHPHIDLVDFCKGTLRKVYEKSRVIAGFVKNDEVWEATVGMPGENDIGAIRVYPSSSSDTNLPTDVVIFFD